MNIHLQNAKNEFWRAYSAVRAALAKLPRHQLVDLQHDARDIMRQMQISFSDRAAAELTNAACTELLKETK